MGKREIEVKPDWYDEELEQAVGTVAARNPWTPQQDAKLARYYPRGVPILTLADSLGHTGPSVRFRVVQLGLRRAMRKRP